ncbi:Stk1 family PASTA domain-containing Ser/Thr kinase [Nocardioides aequoreus]|uniref:Stk1 family PASTA domain-containing Ser/Thr kinase n=1 Tax=Nocardioides aequoreus TaxID=397278 RepID=UPI0004C3E16A|nr:Stk1 family PASTA domain-containing Ser/Thr kinase [Nocardioides aequoreus]
MERTAQSLTGRVLDGRYRLEEQIARGGMATVHRATDLRLDRTVAVKVMHDGLAHDDDFVRRFQREARAAARLSHPGVVAVFDTGDDDGTLYLVMELVGGRTLRQLIREEAPLRPVRALRLVESVLEALAAAHAAGIVHRDVKPENVLVTEEGRVKVADFGLSRAVSADTQHTATGEVLIGTVSYLSPELVVDGRADARADVYATGVVLFELLTASKPHQADSPIQVAYKHVHEDVPAPSSRVDGVPDYVDALVARATARTTELRPADARVLLHQVRQVRLALEQGVTHDSELTADLTPLLLSARTGSDREPTPDPAPDVTTDELPEILEAREVVQQHELVGAGVGTASGRSHEPTGEVYDQERDRGATVVAAPPVPPPATRPGTPGPARPRRSRRGPVALLLVLLLAAGAGVAGWWFGVARYTDTPAVLGMTQAAAEQRLDAAGLSLDVGDPAYSETVERGLVISSDPAPGDRVLDAGTVDVVLSLGPERYDVPDLAGSSVDDAQQALLDTNLTYGGSTERFHEEVPEGEVITTDPRPGTELKRDAAVDLVVSRGPEPIEIPDLTGRDADRAAQALGERGFEVDTSEEHSDSVAEGRVISQSPDSGTGVRGDTVELVVSLGPVMVDVPRVIGMGVDAAVAELEAAGFQVERQRSNVYIGVQYVVSQSPSGGSARKGSTVTIGIV